MAKRGRKGKKRIRGVSGRFQRRRAKKSSGQIPTEVLVKRYHRLGAVITKRGKSAVRALNRKSRKR